MSHLPVDLEEAAYRTWSRRMSRQIGMIMAFKRDRDPRLVGLMSKIPPPPKLVEAIIKLSTMYSMAISPNWKAVIFIYRRQLYRVLDMFYKEAVPVEGIGMKERAPGPGEIEIMELPASFAEEGEFEEFEPEPEQEPKKKEE